MRNLILILLVGVLAGILGLIKLKPAEYVSSKIFESPAPRLPKHLATPPVVKGIYLTSWVAGTKDWRRELVEFVKNSELNSVVIDVKDYSGRVAFDTQDEVIKSLGAQEVRIKDLKEFIAALHADGIYTIARITVFQDPYYAQARPELGVGRKSKPGVLWRDKKGLAYVDPAAREFWEYIVRLSRAAERAGFDELNFDYIRFPSDGNVADMVFPLSGRRNKVEVLDEFFAFLRRELLSSGVPLSADIFGMTTTNYDDLNIGQVLERIEPHFDYISPMVYPSHYPSGFQNLKNPAAHPYEVVHFSMKSARERLIKATSTPQKLRPWLQDFALGADYGAEMVELQKKAVYDAGLQSWLSWNPANKYTQEAYR